MISTITAWVMRHKRLVIGFWIVLTLVGGASSGAATKAMKQKFSVPGKEGWEGNKEIAATFHGTGGNAAPLVPVVTLKGSAQAVRGQLAGLEQNRHPALPLPRYRWHATARLGCTCCRTGRSTRQRSIT